MDYNLSSTDADSTFCYWVWDFEKIDSLKFADSVVDLIVHKIG